MNTKNDLIKLYSKKILETCKHVPFQEKLREPNVTIRKRSPICGSTITIELVIENNKIIKFSQDVKACSLGTASAAIIGKNILNKNYTDIKTGRNELISMLKENGDIPSPPFQGLEILMPARDYKHRHASILLPFDAIIEGFNRTL
jgi:NifU-like protein involved in Fe-S cluster formation